MPTYLENFEVNRTAETDKANLVSTSKFGLSEANVTINMTIKMICIIHYFSSWHILQRLRVTAVMQPDIKHLVFIFFLVCK